jgi:hypothetical protein
MKNFPGWKSLIQQHDADDHLAKGEGLGYSCQNKVMAD